MSRTRVDSALRGARSNGGWRGRQAVVVFQIALCTLLLTGAGLLVRTFEQLHNLDAGFDRDHVVTFTADPSLSGYTGLAGAGASFCADRASARDTERCHRRPRRARRDARPGHRDDRSDGGPAAVDRRFPEYQPATSSRRSISTTMGIRLVAGRDFTGADDPKAKPEKVVVNQAFVRRFFPNVDPLGQRFGAGPPQRVVERMFEIIGVVSDAKYRSMREPMMPAVYQVVARI